MDKYGWICPRCGKVNAPWAPECECSADVMPWWKELECGSSKFYENPTYTTSTTSNDSTYSTQSNSTSPL